MTAKELINFIAARPRYFEEGDGMQQITKEVAEPIEAYSRLTDPETYEEIQQRGLAAKAQRREQLEQELAAVEEALQEANANLRQAEARRTAISKHLHKETNRRPHPRQEMPVRASGHSHSWAVLLDLAGAALLYLGILTHEGISLSMVLLGSLLIGLGFLWSARIGFTPGRPQARPVIELPPVIPANLRSRLRLLDTEVALLSLERDRLERDRNRLRVLVS